ncbi:glutathione S-transferase [Andreprevotia lacus DSM 23236]|jgi:glutathione S-transferase|uniref:Glutathione S-transferase n=1 Tax=Andreprevotia lacus DSM 23236 TaxID=1121001 RepID=A0A1W1XY33_9NEIS|nr:glutathione S-transferase [Andreprevotia lacus]SMC28812.1 glutathione S-transferase [Andreprevotia lacus DSM 23236]
MKLYTSFTSPFGRKVRVVLLEKKIDCQLIEDVPNTPDSQIASVNPLGKVPVLILDDGKPLYDSSVIVDYLDHVSPVGKLLPAEHRQSVGVKRWEALADGIIDAAILVMNERRRPPAQQSGDWLTRQQQKIDQGLAGLSADLGEHKWCYGGHFSLADIAVGCCLGYLNFRFPELDWAERHPNLAGLYALLGERPSFQDTAPPAAA